MADIQVDADILVAKKQEQPTTNTVSASQSQATSNTPIYSQVEVGEGLPISNSYSYGTLYPSILGSNWSFASMYSIDAFDLVKAPKKLNLSLNNAIVVGVNVEQINNNIISEYVGGEWMYASSSRDDIRNVELTFRCYDNMVLYNALKAKFYDLVDKYPEDQMWEIKVSAINNSISNGAKTSISPYDVVDGHHMLGNTYGQTVLNTNTAIMTNISGITFDSGSTDIVTFMCTFTFSLEQENQ